MALRFPEELRQPRTGTAVHLPVHIGIAQKIAVIHPGRPHRQDAHLLLRQPQRLCIQTDKPGLPCAAHPCQDRQPGRFQGNMEIDQILPAVQQPRCLCRIGKPPEKILLRERLFRRDFRFPCRLRPLLAFRRRAPSAGRLFLAGHLLLCGFLFLRTCRLLPARFALPGFLFRDLRRLFLRLCLRLPVRLLFGSRFRCGSNRSGNHLPRQQPFPFSMGRRQQDRLLGRCKGIVLHPQLPQDILICRHGTETAPQIGQELLRHEPQRRMAAPHDMRRQPRPLQIDLTVPQSMPVLCAEIRTALADHHPVESIIGKRSENNPASHLSLQILRRRHDDPRSGLIIPVFLRQPRKRLSRQDMVAELVDIPAENGILSRSECRHGVIVPILIHARNGAFLLHILHDEILVVFNARRKGNEPVSQRLPQMRQCIRLPAERIESESDPAHEAGEAESFRLPEFLGKHRHGVGKKAVVLRPRLGYGRLHHRADAPQDSPRRRPLHIRIFIFLHTATSVRSTHFQYGRREEDFPKQKKIPESFQCTLPSRPNRMMPCLKSGKGNPNFPPSAAAEKPSREPFSDRHRQTRGHRPAAPPVPKTECLPLYCNPFPVPEKERK